MVDASTDAHYRIIRNFLLPGEATELLDLARSNEHLFGSTLVSAGDAKVRHSLTLPAFEHRLRAGIEQKIFGLAARYGFDIAGRPVAPRAIELQLTAHNNGHYFRLHRDRTSYVHNTRTLTCVYYFHTTPKPYTGGSLRLYASKGAGDSARPGPLVLDYSPRHNSLIMFSSDTFHEVTQVSCRSKSLSHSRFTLNGWVLE